MSPNKDPFKITKGQKIFNVFINMLNGGLTTGFLITDSKWFIGSWMILIFVSSQLSWWYNRRISMPFLKIIANKLS